MIYEFSIDLYNSLPADKSVALWPGFTFVTQRVADLIIKQKIKHVYLKEAAKMSFYPYNRKVGFVARPLRLIFPEDRAKELGEPLGIYWWE